MPSEAPSVRLEVRLPPEVHATLERAAELQGLSLADFVVSVAYEAACHAIAEADLVRLSAEDQRRIADALLDPLEPPKALERAFRRRHDLTGP